MKKLILMGLLFSNHAFASATCAVSKKISQFESTTIFNGQLDNDHYLVIADNALSAKVVSNAVMPKEGQVYSVVTAGASLLVVVNRTVGLSTTDEYRVIMQDLNRDFMMICTR